jgi:hypothetical protein
MLRCRLASPVGECPILLPLDPLNIPRQDENGSPHVILPLATTALVESITRA